MNQNPHWKQLIRTWAAIIFGNALYSLTVALFLEPAGSSPARDRHRAGHRAIDGPVRLGAAALHQPRHAGLGLGGPGPGLRPQYAGQQCSQPRLPRPVRGDGEWPGADGGHLPLHRLRGPRHRRGAGHRHPLRCIHRRLDIPPLVLNKWFKLPVSATMLAFDIMVLLMQAVFSPMPQVLYGIVMVLIHTVVMDKMLMMGASRTEVKIISSQSDTICAAILEQLDRGVTILHGEGGYTHESSAVLLSIVSNRELPRLEKLAHSIDPTCFLIVSHVTEVSGRGFSMDKDYL